jgi:hypothetical protein
MAMGAKKPINATKERKQKISIEKHKALALKAAREAMKVLRYFEKEEPEDGRPRKAIMAARAWAKGKKELGMAEVRKLSLDAHAAARSAKNPVATFAARAAGHAIATWHVPTHAEGPKYYTAKLRSYLAKEKQKNIKKV